jgi:hypothetical protein
MQELYLRTDNKLAVLEETCCKTDSLFLVGILSHAET